MKSKSILALMLCGLSTYPAYIGIATSQSATTARAAASLNKKPVSKSDSLMIQIKILEGEARLKNQTAIKQQDIIKQQQKKLNEKDDQ